MNFSHPIRGTGAELFRTYGGNRSAAGCGQIGSDRIGELTLKAQSRSSLLWALNRETFRRGDRS